MDTKLLEENLNNFSLEADKWFSDNNWVIDNYTYFQKFNTLEHIEKQNGLTSKKWVIISMLFHQ
jgi:hypothetical protein